MGRRDRACDGGLESCNATHARCRCPGETQPISGGKIATTDCCRRLGFPTWAPLANGPLPGGVLENVTEGPAHQLPHQCVALSITGMWVVERSVRSRCNSGVHMSARISQPP